MRWNQEHFTGLDWDQKTQTKGIFRIVGKGHKGWSKKVDREMGNYDYLLGDDVRIHSLNLHSVVCSWGMQIDHRHPEVLRDFFAWGPWVLEVLSLSG